MPFLKVGALPVPAFLYYFYVVVRGGFLKHLESTPLCADGSVSKEAGSLFAPWRVLLKFSMGVEEVKKRNALENSGSGSEVI